MKAILVFDVNGFTYEAIKEWFTGDIFLYMGSEGFIDFKDVELKPMPEYKKPIMYSDKYGYGWNDCIKEILGEQDENYKNKQEDK